LIECKQYNCETVECKQYDLEIALLLINSIIKIVLSLLFSTLVIFSTN